MGKMPEAQNFLIPPRRCLMIYIWFVLIVQIDSAADNGGRGWLPLDWALDYKCFATDGLLGS